MEYSLHQLSDLTTFSALFPLSFFSYDKEERVTRYYVLGLEDETKISFFSVGLMNQKRIVENYFSLSNGIPILGLTRIMDQEGEVEVPIHKDLFEDEFNSDIEFILCQNLKKKYCVVPSDDQVFLLSEV